MPKGNPAQASLLEPFAHARHQDPVTSKEAAASVRALTQTQERVLIILHTFGELTDEEIAAAYRDVFPAQRITDQSIRSRRAELEDQGDVVKSTEFGQTRFGRRCHKWSAV